MSKAHIRCGGCNRDFEFSGLSCESCFCPHCSNKVSLNGANGDGSRVELIEAFGFGD